MSEDEGGGKRKEGGGVKSVGGMEGEECFRKGREERGKDVSKIWK